MEKQTVKNLTPQEQSYYGYTANLEIWQKMLKFSRRKQIQTFENQRKTKK